MEHLEQAVIKLELLLCAAKAAQSPEEVRVIRSAQTMIIDALLEQKARLTSNPTIRIQRIDVLHPARRLIEGVSKGD